jgi:hypothetical protein
LSKNSYPGVKLMGQGEQKWKYIKWHIIEQRPSLEPTYPVLVTVKGSTGQGPAMENFLGPIEQKRGTLHGVSLKKDHP